MIRSKRVFREHAHQERGSPFTLTRDGETREVVPPEAREARYRESLSGISIGAIAPSSIREVPEPYEKGHSYSIAFKHPLESEEEARGRYLYAGIQWDEEVFLLAPRIVEVPRGEWSVEPQEGFTQLRGIFDTVTSSWGVVGYERVRPRLFVKNPGAFSTPGVAKLIGLTAKVFPYTPTSPVIWADGVEVIDLAQFDGGYVPPGGDIARNMIRQAGATYLALGYQWAEVIRTTHFTVVQKQVTQMARGAHDQRLPGEGVTWLDEALRSLSRVRLKAGQARYPQLRTLEEGWETRNDTLVPIIGLIWESHTVDAVATCEAGIDALPTENGSPAAEWVASLQLLGSYVAVRWKVEPKIPLDRKSMRLLKKVEDYLPFTFPPDEEYEDLPEEGPNIPFVEWLVGPMISLEEWEGAGAVAFTTRDHLLSVPPAARVLNNLMEHLPLEPALDVVPLIEVQRPTGIIPCGRVGLNGQEVRGLPIDEEAGIWSGPVTDMAMVSSGSCGRVIIGRGPLGQGEVANWGHAGSILGMILGHFRGFLVLSRGEPAVIHEYERIVNYYSRNRMEMARYIAVDGAASALHRQTACQMVAPDQSYILVGLPPESSQQAIDMAMVFNGLSIQLTLSGTGDYTVRGQSQSLPLALEMWGYHDPSRWGEDARGLFRPTTRSEVAHTLATVPIKKVRGVGILQLVKVKAGIRVESSQDLLLPVTNPHLLHQRRQFEVRLLMQLHLRSPSIPFSGPLCSALLHWVEHGQDYNMIRALMMSALSRTAPKFHGKLLGEAWWLTMKGSTASFRVPTERDLRVLAEYWRQAHGVQEAIGQIPLEMAREMSTLPVGVHVLTREGTLRPVDARPKSEIDFRQKGFAEFWRGSQVVKPPAPSQQSEILEKVLQGLGRPPPPDRYGPQLTDPPGELVAIAFDPPGTINSETAWALIPKGKKRDFSLALCVYSITDNLSPEADWASRARDVSSGGLLSRMLPAVPGGMRCGKTYICWVFTVDRRVTKRKVTLNRVLTPDELFLVHTPEVSLILRKLQELKAPLPACRFPGVAGHVPGSRLLEAAEELYFQRAGVSSYRLRPVPYEVRDFLERQADLRGITVEKLQIDLSLYPVGSKKRDLFDAALAQLPQEPYWGVGRGGVAPLRRGEDLLTQLRWDKQPRSSLEDVRRALAPVDGWKVPPPAPRIVGRMVGVSLGDCKLWVPSISRIVRCEEFLSPVGTKHLLDEECAVT
jgi:hypothetical protein